MSEQAIPATYYEWHHCITVKCRIDLTPEFARARAAALADASAEETRRFVARYGDDHRERILQWSLQAAR